MLGEFAVRNRAGSVKRSILILSWFTYYAYDAVHAVERAHGYGGEGVQLRVAGAQIPVTPNISDNVENLLWAISRAHELGAEYLITPEGSLSGYTWEFDRSLAAQGLERVRTAASQVGLGLVLGTCWDEAHHDPTERVSTYDGQLFYAPNGTLLGWNAKQLLCSDTFSPFSGEAAAFTRGKPTVVKLPVAGGLHYVRAGGLVCNDLWAWPPATAEPDPHLTHTLAWVMGASVIFHSANPGPGGPWYVLPYSISNLAVRAATDAIHIVTVSPMASSQDGVSGVMGPDGNWVELLPLEEKDVYIATITLPVDEIMT